jgi:hypothetical protein
MSAHNHKQLKEEIEEKEVKMEMRDVRAVSAREPPCFARVALASSSTTLPPLTTSPLSPPPSAPPPSPPP